MAADQEELRDDGGTGGFKREELGAGQSAELKAGDAFKKWGIRDTPEERKGDLD